MAPICAKDSRITWVADGIEYAICNESEVAIIDAYTEADSILIPDSIAYEGFFLQVVSIEKKAFQRCEQLSYIDLPKGLHSIERSAFEKTHYYTSSKSWDKAGVLKQKHYLLSVKPHVVKRSYHIEEGIEVIAKDAFADCVSLEELHLPSTLTFLQAEAIRGTAIERDTGKWKDGVLYIDDWAIQCKKTLAHTIRLKEGTHSMADGLFKQHREIREVVFPSTMRHICRDAFLGCIRLDSIHIGDSIQNIGRQAFIGCTNLRSFHCSPTTCTIEAAAFYECMRLQTLQLSASLTKIPLGMCYHCESLQNITIPSAVQRIDDYAFSGCKNLLSVGKITTSVRVSPTAFEGCDSLEDYR